MMQTLIHHAAACLVTLLSLVALTFIAKRLGLTAWIAWLDRRHRLDRPGENRRRDDRGGRDHRQEGRGKSDRHHGRHSEGSQEYWSIHQ